MEKDKQIMEKDKQDLQRFFNSIKSKYEIPYPDTNITGKVTCRNGFEYIEKPFNALREIDEIRQESRLTRQRKYDDCGHYSSVTIPYRSLGDIVLDPKRLTLKQFNSSVYDRDPQDLAIAHINKWRNATKVVFPAVRMNKKQSYSESMNEDGSAGSDSTIRRRKQRFVVQHKDWPKIQSTGYVQLSDAVNMTNKRVAAARGATTFFRVFDSDERDSSLDSSADSGLLDDSSITKLSVIETINREEVIKRLEAFVYVLDYLAKIKNRDLKTKHPVRHDSTHNICEEKQQRQATFTELPPIKGQGFSWNEGIPPWQKIKQENEFLASLEKENADKGHKTAEAKDQEFLSNLRKDFVALQEKLDSHLCCRLRRFFRDDKEKFVRRFHALKHAPTLSLGMVDVRRVDRGNNIVDNESKKTSSKQDWFVEALKELKIKCYSTDPKVCSLLEQFERFSHTDLAEEIKLLKAKLCYLTFSIPVYFVLQPDYQYAIIFVIKNCLGTQEDPNQLFGSWFKMRFKKGKLTASAHT